MDNNIIEVTGIPNQLLKLIDKRVRQKGSDRARYIRELIEKDIFGISERQTPTQVQDKQRTFDHEKWESDMKLLTSKAEKIPVLPPEAFTRESIYENHD